MSNPTDDPQRVLDVALRRELAAFIQRSFNEVVPGSPFLPNWHIDAIAYALEQVLAGKITRLLITVPPRYLKSISASVAFPAWVLGHDPTRRIVAVSYADDLAGKHAQDCRRIIDSPWYRRVFPGTRLSRSKNSEGEYVTTKSGFRLSLSTGGGVTGRGGNLIIIDDPLKPVDALSDARREAVNAWYDNTLSSRIDNKAKDPIILVMQRLHLDDLVGHVLEQEPWFHLNLPAIAEVAQNIPIGDGLVYCREVGELLHAEREPRTVLEKLQRTMGGYQFSAQYQQEPVPVEGNLLRWPWFKTYREAPPREDGDWIIQSWDTACVPGQDNDYCVGTTWLVKGNEYYLLHILREKMDYPTLKRTVKAHAARWRADDLVIEYTNSGLALVQELRADGLPGGTTVSPVQPKIDKLTRMAIHTPILESGRVFIPEEAPWLAEFRKEVLQFPHGRHDDQVDSMSQFLYRLRFAPMVHIEYPPARQYPRRDRGGDWPTSGFPESWR